MIHAPSLHNLTSGQRLRLLGAFPTNHWLHRMKEHVVGIGLQVDTSTEEWQANGTAYPHLGYLLGEGAFSSNPCGAACLLNPVYDFLPRGGWTVASGLCQRWSDFLYDPASNTLCCPSPDYCCPHTATNCSASSGVQRFSLATANGGAPVPAEQLASPAADGWRRHFLSLERRQGLDTLCHAERGEWNGGARQPACFWSMDDASVSALRTAWQSVANNTLAPMHDDDDTHQWAVRGAPPVH